MLRSEDYYFPVTLLEARGIDISPVDTYCRVKVDKRQILVTHAGMIIEFTIDDVQLLDKLPKWRVDLSLGSTALPLILLIAVSLWLVPITNFAPITTFVASLIKILIWFSFAIPIAITDAQQLLIIQLADNAGVLLVETQNVKDTKLLLTLSSIEESE